MREVAIDKRLRRGLAVVAKPTVMFVTIAVLSVTVALIASFTLAEWAELSPLNHALQHVLLFSGGLGAGAVMTAYIASSKKGRK